MKQPTFSVVVPVYNGAADLAETIKSVLAQTYPDFELILVDDCSTDNSVEIVSQFDDPRLVCIEHEKNQGALVARNNGVKATKGKIVAFLDQDDLFHPDKLKEHEEYLLSRPEVGFTYNARFNFHDSPDNIQSIWRPSYHVTLADLVLGFPFSPSEMVIRKDWLFQAGLWDETHDFHGGEIMLAGRLYMAGCKFAGIDRPLNYRRYHRGRMYGDLEGKCRSELEAQDKVFADPRCPEDVLALRDVAHKNIFLIWAFHALIQNETKVGHKLMEEGIKLDPALIEGDPCPLIKAYAYNSVSVARDSEDHEVLLKRIFTQLPDELAKNISRQCLWAVGYGYLRRGVQAIMWGRTDEGHDHFDRAAALNAQLDETILGQLEQDLMSYEAAFGPEATKKVIRELALNLKRFGDRSSLRLLKGKFLVSQAFKNYDIGEYSRVPGEVIGSLVNNPGYMANRGVLAILFRSICYSLRQGLFNPK